MAADLGLAELADRFGVPAEFAREADGRGLIPREDDGKVGPAASRRLRLVAVALRRGITGARLLEALESFGDLTGSFDDLAPAPSDLDVDGMLAEVGIDATLGLRLLAASGVDTEDVPSVDDAQAMRMARQALDLGLTPDVLVQLLRVFADHTERLAAAETGIFHDHVHEQFRAQGLSGRALIEATSGIANGLQDLMEPTLLYFHRRAWARAAQDDFLRHLTEDSRPLPSSPGARTCTVMFADLSGFTPLTAAMGDDAAAEVLARFGDAVRRLTTRHHGRVVKQIGDAFMVVFDDRLEAVSCGVSLLTWCNAESRFPPVHIGAHAGEVLFREGDFVGAAVNLAARVASVTEPAQFLVTSQVLSGLDLPEDVDVVERGPRVLKGLHLPVELMAIRAAGAPLTTDATDPVCGMRIGAVAAGLQRDWAGHTYSFCSHACAEQFTADPRRYAHPALR